MLSLFVGLGNIGAAYAGTRHNVGFEVVRKVAEALKAVVQPSTTEYDWAVAGRDENEIVFMLPRLYMNRSGAAIEALLQREELTPEQMLVIVDDVNLPLGRLRFRRDGSDGGHNGIASIIETLESENFPRLRLGIGSPPDTVDRADFVLSRFEREEIEPKEKMIAAATEAVLFAKDHCLEEAMTTYNVNPA
jgi:PTH1 family peptidyl-tRNA hydrolase